MRNTKDEFIVCPTCLGDGYQESIDNDGTYGAPQFTKSRCEECDGNQEIENVYFELED